MDNSSTNIPVFLPKKLDWQGAEEIALRYGSAHQHSNFGPLVSRLEEVVGHLLNVEPNLVVAFSNCTDALAASIATSEHQSSAVIPSFSFLATLRAAQVALPGAIKVEDVGLDTWSLQVGRVLDQGELLVPVSPFGLNPLATLEAYKHPNMVVDAAASLATLPDLSAIESGQAVCFSLHATKVLGAGEGGLGVYGSAEWAERARGWSNFGRHEGAVADSGTNSKMSEVQAAFCLSRLERLQEEIEEWRLAQSIAAAVSAQHSLKVQPHGFDSIHPYWTVELDSSEQRIALEDAMRFSNIGTRRWWPLDLSTLNGQTALRNSSSLADRTLGLPMFCGLTEEQGERISEAIEIACL